MKRFSIIILAALLSGCGVYKKYTPQTEAPDDLFGQIPEEMQNEQLAEAAELSWREFFTDPVLQALIDSALVRNTDLKAARI